MVVGTAPQPAARVGGAGAYTDGGVEDGDALLARAAWAAVLVDEAGAVVRQVSGAVGGLQTAPRAELTAALWVAGGSAGLVPGVTRIATMCEPAWPRCASRGAPTPSPTCNTLTAI